MVKLLDVEKHTMIYFIFKKELKGSTSNTISSINHISIMYVELIF
jgi:hypothetical protein